jgi:hypothetical protein
MPFSAPVSATDAIGLAFTHTRTVLAPTRFRPGRFFKLALLAAFTQASFLSVSISYPAQGAQVGLLSHTHHIEEQFSPGDGIGAIAGGLGLVLLVVLAGLVLLLTLAYLYLLCRARATLFDLVVFRGGRIREAWRRRGRAAWRYFGFSLLAMLIFMTLLAATLGPFLVRFFKVMTAQPGALAVSPAAGSLMLTLVGLIWLLLPLWIAIDALLQDFILPGLALDQQAPVAAAFARVGAVIRRAPGQMLLFLVLRTIVPLGIGIALGLVALVGVGLIGLGGYGVGRVLYHALWSGGLGAHAVFFAYVAGAGLLVAVLYWIAITAVYGITGVFRASYAALFYAGYYPELADALEGTLPKESLLPPPPGPAGIW